jgi:hypothetical protein
MGGGSVYGGDDEEIDVSEDWKASRRLLILHRVALSTLMRSRIMVRRGLFVYSTWLLTLEGVNATDITKMKQQGIHTVGVSFFHVSPCFLSVHG